MFKGRSQMALNSSTHGGTTRVAGRIFKAARASALAGGLLLALSPAAGAATFSNPTPIDIPLGIGLANPYPSPIVVSGLTGTTTDVNVTLRGFTHTFPRDVKVVLVPPEGTNILLMSNVANGDDANNLDVTFDGSASGQIPTTTLGPGPYLPTSRDAPAPFPPPTPFASPGPGNRLCNPGPGAGFTPCNGPDTLGAALNGFNPNGTWQLFVNDLFAGFSGSIARGWSLDITTDTSPRRTLIVNNPTSGTGTLLGTGSVVSAGTGPKIDCGGVCAAAYPDGRSVDLTPTPTIGSNFAGWSGCDRVSGTICTSTINGDKRVTANFQPNPPQDLAVAKTGTGTGTVTGLGISCGSDCTETYNGETPVELIAEPSAAGSRFAGWRGCSTATNNTCVVTMSTARNVTASFTQGADPVEPPAPTSITVTGPARIVPAPAPEVVRLPSAPVAVDRRAPGVGLSGVRSSMSLRSFLKGVRVRVTRSEASTIEATLDAVARRATLVAAFNVSLASKRVALSTGTRTITLKPNRRLVAKAKRFRVRVSVVVEDAAGNRRTRSKTITVKR